MVIKESHVKFILIASGLVIMMLVLLSKVSTTSKSIGVILSLIVIVMGVVITGPLRKHFEETREGTMNPDYT